LSQHSSAIEIAIHDMMLFSLPANLCLSVFALIVFSNAAFADQTSERCDAKLHGKRYTIHAWPVSQPESFPLAQVHHLACPGQPAEYSIAVWTPQKLQSLPDGELVRVGRYLSGGAPDIDNWDGTVTRSETFKSGGNKVLTVWTDTEGKVVRSSVARRASDGQTAGSKDDVQILVKQVEAGPKVQLNKPIVLDESGKVKKEEKDERTFLQK
jgi:hypothetical protein